MKVNKESLEAAMEMLCAMTVEDMAAQSGQDIETTYKAFRRSQTFSNLFDDETGLWMNGPDYIIDEYERARL